MQHQSTRPQPITQQTQTKRNQRSPCSIQPLNQNPPHLMTSALKTQPTKPTKQNQFPKQSLKQIIIVTTHLNLKKKKQKKTTTPAYRH